LLFKRTNELKVDLGDLESEKENLSNFLRSHFKINSSSNYEGLKLDAEDVSPQELERMVNKFVYHRDLNNTHWVALERNVVKINRFKHSKKNKKNKNPLPPSKISHGW
jgi:hypothetical protein